MNCPACNRAPALLGAPPYCEVTCDCPLITGRGSTPANAFDDWQGEALSYAADVAKLDSHERTRHKYGPMKERGDFKDGTYQVCTVCGAIRFRGDRYSFPRSPCKSKPKRTIR